MAATKKAVKKSTDKSKAKRKVASKAKKTTKNKLKSHSAAARSKEGLKGDGSLKKGYKYVKGGRVVKAKAAK
jgi:hypothetical protein